MKAWRCLSNASSLNTPDQAINHILLGLGYFDDVDPDETLPAPRQQIVDYWTRRQREIIAARSR